MPTPGRRKGNPATREEIVGAARAIFGEKGYDRTSIREIGAAAGVDPALVYHYFDDKAALFAASIHLPFDPRTAIGVALDERDGAGERLAAVFLSGWEPEQPRDALLGILRGILGGNPVASEAIRSVLVATIKSRLEAISPGPDVEMRALGIVSQLIGMAIVRYVLEVEPLASATKDEVVPLIGARLQTYVNN